MWLYFCSIVRVRETRLTAIFSHILIGLSLLILNYLAYIPTPVLYGLFLYVGVTALYGNQLFERIMLLITEQVISLIYYWCKFLILYKYLILQLYLLSQIARIYHI